ncbi:MAG: putative sulfate exporter family transporter [Betaproteobacteria bacterium]|nr:MAG: putative sulfate exporter family transporter [Betaproteobacteria bacterium]
MDPKGVSEDWLSVWIGLLVFVLALGVLDGADILGWVVTTAVWADPSKALAPVSKNYAGLGGVGALIATYVALLAVMTAGAAALKADIKRFALGFTAVFWISYLCWIAGSYANFAVTTPADMQKFGISWSLKLTNEGGFIVALAAGLVIGNFFPGFAGWMKEAVRPEWYIKTAIVILGGFLGMTAAAQPILAKSVMFRGLAAIIEAYLIYWAVVYFVARKWFGFSREWAAPLASGISICGVSAAIATGSAIRARPIVPVMVASLVVLFAVVELLILPFAANAFLSHEPMVAGAWMGLAVKTDGAAVASGAITESLILAAAAAEGINYAKGWILGATTMVKVFIDIFIGIWAFILAWIWTRHIDVRPGDKAKIGEIWERFPKFIIGYVVTFLVILLLALGATPEMTGKIRSSMGEANTFRGIFFVMTFFSIGVMSNFRKLWEEGIGKLAAVYIVCLFGFVIWVGLVISWVFFGGVKPPLAAG